MDLCFLGLKGVRGIESRNSESAGLETVWQNLPELGIRLQVIAEMRVCWLMCLDRTEGASVVSG